MKESLKPTTQMHPDEWELRVALAACYRLVAMYGWSDLVFTHISAKLPASVSGEEHQFLINPYGLMFDEITASSLVKVDMQCNKLDGDNPHPVNPAGFVIHSAVHEARHEAGCVLHTHTRGRGCERTKGRHPAHQPAKHICFGVTGLSQLRRRCHSG